MTEPTRGSAPKTDGGAEAPTVDPLFEQPSLEQRVVRDSIKARLFPGLTASETPPRIGRFEVERKLGEGGMGVVFLAHDGELDRMIAVKLLRRSADTERSAARLAREAQALARISHPNVVQVHEIGSHDDQVFLAMEYVRGQTLRRWLADRARPWRERLAVMLQAGRGLEAAHAAGLVHRDFKPDNVLVGDDGRVRVVDFGLVREDASELRTIPDAEDAPLGQTLTRTGTLMGTPIYMSPEQHRGEAADSLGDQFGFCVTVWEAIYGRRPFPHSTLTELVEAVRTKQIIAPRDRSAEDAGVPRAVRAHLERGLEPERIRRWPSMTELLDALERELEPPRRSPLLGLGLGLGAALLATFVALVWTDERAGAQACELGPELLDGTFDADAAAAIERSFTATDLDYADETHALVAAGLERWTGQWIAARRDACEAARLHPSSDVARREACLAAQRSELAGVVAILRDADARVVEHGDELIASLPDPAHCSGADLDADRPTLPEDPDARAASLAARERLGQVRALRIAGRLDEAEALADAVLAEPIVARVPTLALEARAERAFVTLKRREGARDEPAARLRELANEVELAGDDALATRLRLELAVLSTGLLSGPQPERWLIEDARLALARSGLATERERAQLALAQARVEQHAGQLAPAVAGYREVIEQADAHGWPRLAVDASIDLAAALDDLGELEQAEAGHRDVVERLLGRFGPDHPLVAKAEIGHALHAILVGDTDAAARLLDEAEPVVLASHGRASATFARIALARANLAALDGRWSDARELLEPALATVERELGPLHEETGRTLDFLGTLRYFEGDLAGALAAYDRALAILEARFDPGHEALAVVHGNRGDALLALGRLAEATRAFDASLAALELELGLGHPVACVALAGRGEVALADGRPLDAIPDLEAALALLEGPTGDLAERAQTQLTLARALVAAAREPDRARELATAARGAFVALELHDSVSALDEWRARLD